jgi:hypothetical protein
MSLILIKGDDSVSLFKKKPKIKFDVKKKEISVLEVISIEEVYSLIVKYFELSQEEAPIDLTINGQGVITFTLTDDWVFAKKTVSMFNQKVNRRYKRKNTATSSVITTQHIRT